MYLNKFRLQVQEDPKVSKGSEEVKTAAKQHLDGFANIRQQREQVLERMKFKKLKATQAQANLGVYYCLLSWSFCVDPESATPQSSHSTFDRMLWWYF